MSRDPRKLRVFVLADNLVIDVYRATALFPVEERFGLQIQLRRAAVSSACNIVEGSARRTTREYIHFLNIATGSSAEAQYLLDIAFRLKLISDDAYRTLTCRYSELLKGLKALIHAIEHMP